MRRLGRFKRDMQLLDIIIGPDVYVNASVALGSPPEKVVTRVLGRGKGVTKTTQWILDRTKAMLGAHPNFKHDAVEHQVGIITGLVTIVDDGAKFGPDEWEKALLAAAKAAGVHRIVTDHPDLVGKETAADGIEFFSTESWLVEAAMPPPPPPGAAKKSAAPPADEKK